MREAIKRLTKKMMDERLEQMRKLTGLDLGFSYFNGYTHLYNIQNGENIITGSGREVFDAMYFYMLGYRNCLDKKECNTHYVDKFIHPYHGTECLVYQFNESYYYTDSLEYHKEMHYICEANEDYIDALADIFF